MTLTWDSNPYACGVIDLRLDGRKAAIGGLSIGKVVKGYFLSELVYEGLDVDSAMRAVESRIRSLPEYVIRGFRD